MSGKALMARSLAPADLEAWDGLASRHGTLFNCSDWLALFGDNMQALGIFEDGGQLVGGLSLYQERRFGLKIFRRAPFTPTCGPFLEVKAQNPVAILETRRKALESVIEYLAQQSAAIVMLPLDQQIVDALPFLWRGYKVIPNYTYLIDLSLSLADIQKNMTSSQRNHIAKARKDLLTVEPTSDMHIVRDLVLATFDRQKKSLDRSTLEAILFRFANSSNSFAFTTYRGRNPIATCFVVHDHRTAYNLLAGYRAEERHHGAGAMAVFEAIKHSQEIGLKTFDFEGSVIPAIEQYFRGFGGKLKSYFTVNNAWMPVEIVLKFMRRSLF